jgi:hypothetical protein
MTLASDDDRERAASGLRAAWEEGRLTVEELDERLGRAYAARTDEELAVVMAGLPAKRAAGEVTAGGRGYGGGEIALAVAGTVLLPFGRLIGLVVALALLRGETVPARCRQLVLWAQIAGILLAVEVAVVILALALGWL